MPTPATPAPERPAPTTPAPATPQPSPSRPAPPEPAPARPDQPSTVPDTEAGDHDRFAHYVSKDKLNRALVEGTPVRALCGKLWVPSRDPERYPVCPTCEELMAALRDAGEGADGEGG